MIEDCKIVQKLGDVSPGCADRWICKHAKSVFVASEKAGAAFSVFMDKFKASDAYKQSGRGADTFSSELYVREVWNAPDKMFLSNKKKVARHLSSAETDVVNSQFFYGNAVDYKNIGLEIGSVGSIKMQMTGTRRLVLTTVESILSYATSMQPVGSIISLEDCASHIREASVEKLEEMKKKGVRFSKALVEEGDLIKIPWGVMVCEEVMNQSVCGGVRMMDISDATSPSFNTVLDMAIKGAQQKKGGTVDLLKRINMARNSHGCHCET